MTSQPGAIVPVGSLSTQELRGAIEESRKRNVVLWDILVEERKYSEEDVARAFGTWLRLPRLHLASLSVEPEAIRSMNEELARKHVCFPVKVEDRSLVLAMANAADYTATQDIQFATGLNIRAVIATRTEILDAISQYYTTEEQLQDFLANVAEPTDLQIVGEEKEMSLDLAGAVNEAELPPVVKMCNVIVQDAIKLKASDVHIEAALNAVHVRLRIDGVLRDYMQIPKWLQSAVVSRLKILGKLDIAERRVPQDGRIKVQMADRNIDLRMSTLPTQFGEKVVLRVLGSSEIPALSKLGFTPDQVTLLYGALGQPQGLLLVTGPTGSGKSTALYSMLQERKSPDINIITVEDPIEYQLAGINQVQVNTKAGLTFASALRSILRQDPDMILVGEIRDLETAEVAFHAAMTGHFVLSTLHTNGTVQTIARLLDMGVDPFLIASSVSLITAQRLARRVCGNCRETYTPESRLLEKMLLNDPNMVFYHGRGCNQCGNTGYSGRVGIYEMLRMTPTVKELIQKKANEAELRKAAGLAGTRFLLEEGMDKVRQGVTTLEEILRVIQIQESEVVRCPQCSAFIDLNFSTCPYCMYALRHLCISCGQELKLEWRICPYCNTRTDFRLPDSVPRHAVGKAATVSEAPQIQAPGAAEAPPAVAAPAETHWRPPALEPPPPPSRSPVVSQDSDTPSVELTTDEDVPTAERGPAIKKPRILIVDDDASIKIVVRKTIEQLPIDAEILQAADGAEALAIAEQNPPDLVITDVMMPNMDGFMLCQKLRENLRTAFVPIMMLTASADEASRTRGFMVGTDDYVGKPFAIGELAARVMRLLRRTYGL